MIRFLHTIIRSGGCRFNHNVTIDQFGSRFSRRVVHANTESASANQSTGFPNKIPIETALRPGDWNCPRCGFFNFSRNIRCLCCEKLNEAKVREVVEEQRHLPLKKGDWNCSKCGFLNFAKNSNCMLCETHTFNRQIHRLEWICDSCNHENSGICTVCERCYYRRPKSITGLAPMPENEGMKKLVADKNQKHVTLYKNRFNRNGRKQSSMELNSKDRNKVEFLDFPIVGGKSEISRNSENWEKWRNDIMKTKNHCGKHEKECQDVCAIQIPDFLQNCSDDEEILEWFVGR